MAVRHGYGKIAGTDALVFAYDTGDTVNSFKGEPTTNYVPGAYNYALYAYASGPVDTVVLNEKNKSITAKRYTITQAVNTARAAIFPSGLTTGVAYTFSFKWKYNGSTTASPAMGITAFKGYPEGGANNNSFTSEVVSTDDIGNGWYLTTYTFVFSSVPTGKCILTFGISTGSTAGYVGETFDIYEAQFEIKDHRTQYANGTRSATQGLLDLTGNYTIDISNVSFDSNAQMTFDGTNDYVRSDASAVLNANTYLTLEAVIKPSSTYSGDIIILGRSAYYLTYQSNDSLSVYWYGKSPAGYHSTSAGTIQRNKYNHIVAVWNDANVKLYINGTLLNTVSSTGTGNSVFNDLWVGSEYDGGQRIFNGEIPVAKIYNRALTADEVRNNYNHYKNRFNI